MLVTKRFQRSGEPGGFLPVHILHPELKGGNRTGLQSRFELLRKITTGFGRRYKIELAAWIIHICSFFPDDGHQETVPFFCPDGLDSRGIQIRVVL